MDAKKTLTETLFWPSKVRKFGSKQSIASTDSPAIRQEFEHSSISLFIFCCSIRNCSVSVPLDRGVECYSMEHLAQERHC